MAEKRGGFYAPRGLRSVVEVQDGAAWDELPGVSSVAHSPGSRDATTISAFEGVMSVLGSQTIEPVTFNISGYQAYQDVWQRIQAAFDDNAPLTFRVSTPANRLYDGASGATGAQVGVDKTTTASKIGGLEFPASPNAATQDVIDGFGEKANLYQRGHAVVVGGVTYIVKSIDVDASGVLTDFVPADPGSGGVRVTLTDFGDIGADVPEAADFEVWEPGVRISFAARVESPAGFNVGAAASEPLSATLTVRPLTPLARPVLYTT